jgi:hypothetical protein
VHGKEDFHVLEPVRNKHQTFWLHNKNLIGKQVPIPASDPQANTCFFGPKPSINSCGNVALGPKVQDLPRILDPRLSHSILPHWGRNFSSGKTDS